MDIIDHDYCTKDDKLFLLRLYEDAHGAFFNQTEAIDEYDVDVSF